MIADSADFEAFANYFMSMRKSEATTPEEVMDFALRSVSDQVRRGAISFLEDVLSRPVTGAELQQLWRRQERMYPRTPELARWFTETVLARMKDPAAPDRS